MIPLPNTIAAPTTDSGMPSRNNASDATRILGANAKSDAMTMVQISASRKGGLLSLSSNVDFASNCGKTSEPVTLA
jgi:hypothetical protein